ncbi:hypothetical protein GQ55_4G043800 [Panicum hallii var. hallii]|uniref:Endonuclease/exonuclease/phosphatase domain-containing protein n=1 Tax=Panicum hallii var. hallii TaxID=1504633 RepID=A0A2T7DV66_9POAL|nr:hypothetical protein GQ55_4G043800 [Panicum hallii var. hallii]
MKGIFWDSRGLSDLAKTKFRVDTAGEQNLDFIALLETGKRDFSLFSLNGFCGGKNFLWYWTEPHGRSGGILLGVNIDVLDIGSIEEGDYYVKFRLKNKSDNFQWVLVAVYGAAQPEYKENFLTGLAISISSGLQVKKNNNIYNDKWTFLFNAIIDGINLREIEMSGRKYTWANSLANPTYERLDRVLVSTEWEQHFPLVTVIALSREISDHTPLLLSTGEGASHTKPPLFKFVLGWLLREGFFYLVSELLSQQKINLKQCVKDRLAQLLREEEIKWFQRAKTKELLQGDNNTRYFQLVANGKRRKMRIFWLEQEEG